MSAQKSTALETGHTGFCNTNYVWLFSSIQAYGDTLRNVVVKCTEKIARRKRTSV